MMARNRQIRQEERLARRTCVDPGKHPADRCGFIDAEARVHVPADGARVFERLKALAGDHRVHAEIREAAGMEQPRAIAGRGEDGGN
jgi:hypothetical protein